MTRENPVTNETFKHIHKVIPSEMTIEPDISAPWYTASPFWHAMATVLLPYTSLKHNVTLNGACTARTIHEYTRIGNYNAALIGVMREIVSFVAQ